MLYFRLRFPMYNLSDPFSQYTSLKNKKNRKLDE